MADVILRCLDTSNGDTCLMLGLVLRKIVSNADQLHVYNIIYHDVSVCTCVCTCISVYVYV